MKNILKGAKALLFPFDINCYLCGTEKNMGYGSGICTLCYQKLKIESKIEQVDNFSLLSCMTYENECARMISALKFENKQYFAKTLAFIASEVLKTQSDFAFDMLCPVPLHKNRESWRGFNQSERICYYLAEKIEKTLQKDALVRVKDTLPQMTLHRTERIENVKDAFCATNAVENKTILIVDDVATTASTLLACAKAAQAQNARVKLLTLARVPSLSEQ